MYKEKYKKNVYIKTQRILVKEIDLFTYEWTDAY